MTTKEYSTFPKALELEPHCQIQFNVIDKHSLGGGVLLLYRDADKLILPPQPTELDAKLSKKNIACEFDSH